MSPTVSINIWYFQVMFPENISTNVILCILEQMPKAFLLKVQKNLASIFSNSPQIILMGLRSGIDGLQSISSSIPSVAGSSFTLNYKFEY